MVITGHSFGGMIVLSALAQSLIEAASSPVGELVTSFADLVLLINPAIEAARYLPLYDLLADEEFKKRTTSQPPVFICAQAENDEPVGTFFPIGNVLHRVDEATIGQLEKDCLTHALGFVPAFRTHKLTSPTGGASFALDPPGPEQTNPFWVVGASKEVIDGHGGIWLDPFAAFLSEILFQHVSNSRAVGAPARRRA
ncbi:hypothetical protein [Beijerinckia sp. L45]|uniref:hypothetical protein n=1 Tax=Beijerinckia sp. L45 TaxID=1641855 RepID=UPI00131D99A0|nr:hypothetical protein [Beijerinckia sp. L45]